MGEETMEVFPASVLLQTQYHSRKWVADTISQSEMGILDQIVFYE